MKLDGKTNPELIAMAQAIMDDPANNLTGSLWLYTPKARKKLDLIAKAVAANMAAARAARGDPVPTCGYSGRQTNRRR